MAQTTSRRAFLGAGSAMLATAGAGTAATAAAPPDPMFALIERERQAWQAFNDAIEETWRAEEEVDRRPDSMNQWFPPNDGSGEVSPELRWYRAAEARERAADDVASDALYEVMAATPATAAGVVAMLDLFWARAKDHISDPQSTNLQNLFAGIREFVGRQA